MKKIFAVGLSWVLLIGSVKAALYNGNGNSSFGGAIGNGSLSFSSPSSSVNATLTRGPGQFNDILVIFIDSVSGGFVNTSSFSDNSERGASAISGLDFTGGTSRSTANFKSGFTADYAIVLSPNYILRGLYRLNPDATIEFKFNIAFDPGDQTSASSYNFGFSWSDIGITGGATRTFDFETTYIQTTGQRSLESYESLSGTTGYGTVTFGTYDTFPIPVPEATNVALAAFGGIVLVGGIFARVRRVLRLKVRAAEAN